LAMAAATAFSVSTRPLDEEAKVSMLGENE
jgi:hypothetical protein